MQQLRTGVPRMQPEAERGREVSGVHIIDMERMKLHEITAKRNHPDITDWFGRVWVWYHGDTYIHDGDTACLKKFIPTDDERTA